MALEQIRIGTIIGGRDAVRVIPQIAQHGFESYSISFGQSTSGIDLIETAKQIEELAAQHNFIISSVGVYGNPLTGEGDNADTLASWERLIEHAHLFGTDIVAGFTGRLTGLPIEASIPQYAEVFGELSRRADAKGVRIAFENCAMGGTWSSGDWNIALNPSAWELMFNAIPSDNIGLQWEPAHQMDSLIDPIPQLRKWVDKVFHVHGKDATIAWDIVKEYGLRGPKRFVWDRTPGFGDTNWSDIMTILMQANYKGTIDIEGWHDPVYKDELEMTGQVHALNYLKRCRGGIFVPNPAAEGYK